MQKAVNSYAQAKVATSQSDILILLYDAAIRFLEDAVRLIHANDIPGKGTAISKALNIIHELDNCLDMELQNKLVSHMHELYFFCSKNLLLANLKKDTKKVGEVIGILKKLRDTYSEIIHLPEAQAAAEEAAKRLSQKSLSLRNTTPSAEIYAHPGTPTQNTQSRGLANYAKQITQSQVGILKTEQAGQDKPVSSPSTSPTEESAGQTQLKKPNESLPLESCPKAQVYSKATSSTRLAAVGGYGKYLHSS